METNFLLLGLEVTFWGAPQNVFCIVLEKLTFLGKNL